MKLTLFTQNQYLDYLMESWNISKLFIIRQIFLNKMHWRSNECMNLCSDDSKS